MKIPEHFEKKIPKIGDNDNEFWTVCGYNEALEKTNAKGLYEALIMCHSLLKAQFGDGYKEWIEFKETEKALEKANKP